MTAIEERLSSCTFSDALYVTADEGDVDHGTTAVCGGSEIENNRKSKKRLSDHVIIDTSSEYFSAQTHPYSSTDDSGLSCTPPAATSMHGGYYLAESSSVDMELLEITLEDSEMLTDAQEEERQESVYSSGNQASDGQESVYSNENQASDGQDEKNSSNNYKTSGGQDKSIYNNNTTQVTSKRKSSTASNSSFVIVATSHQRRHLSPSSSSFLNDGDDESQQQSSNDSDYDLSSRPNDESASVSSSSSSFYHRSRGTTDGADKYDSFFFEQPSMEYEDTYFAPCAQSSPSKGKQQQKREKIYIRELSFDELQDVTGWWWT